jgi:hypothetical protein
MKTHNFASSLNTLYIAESAQFYSAFSLTTISLTLRFRQKREVWFHFFANNAQNYPKTHSYEDNAKFNSAFLVTTLSHASRFRQKRRVIESFEYLGEFEEYFRKCWLYCVLYLLVTEILALGLIYYWMMQKKVLKQTIKISRMCTFKGTHARYFIVRFSHFFGIIQ